MDIFRLVTTITSATSPAAVRLRRGPRRLAGAGVLGVAVLLAGCASLSAPVVYDPSASPDLAARAQADLQSCRAQAESSVGVNGLGGAKLALSSARRGGSEFVAEAVEQLVAGSRSAWEKARGAAAGAMAGGAVSVALNWNEPDAVYRGFVDRCLKDRGHQVLGWR
jgi:outer membrane lipoprotein SlyB